MKTTRISVNIRRLITTIGSILLCLGASAAQFEDVTVSSGVTNAPGYCLSAGWGDYNNDQLIDLYLAIGFTTPATNVLFRNNGNGTFTRVGSTAGPITTDSHPSFGCAWIDFNNDGYRDLLVLNEGPRNDLYWNNGDGTFRSGNAGNLTQLPQFRSWSGAADYDGDGWVDLYVTEADSQSAPCSRRLYHASPDGTFTSTNLGPTVSYANDGVWGDYDNDGDVDLFVCGYTGPSTLWRNDGRGNFTSVANGLPSNEGTLHASWADYDRDGDLDIALSSWSDTRLYRNDGTNFALAATLAAVTSSAWADYDNDGYLDLLIVGGQGTAQKPGLFHNNGNGSFSRVSDIFTEVADNSLACPWGDYDNDGFMDVILTHQYSQHRLYRNLGNTNHWIKVKLVGTASNRDAIGAKVRVLATIGGQPVWQMQEVNGGYAYQNDTRLNFGLGDATIVDKLRIEWPSGNVQELTSVARDQILTVTEQVLITPVRPTASVGGSVILTSQRAGPWQWYHDGVLLAGQTGHTLTLSSIQLADGGRYSVVTGNPGNYWSNFVYLRVDPTFVKITGQPIVEDREPSEVGVWCDYDNDGFVDVYVANTLTSTPAPRNSLYHNEGNGMFTRVTNALTTVAGDVLVGLWGDYENDGGPDLLTIPYNGSSSLLYHNDGHGIFTRFFSAPFSGSSQVDGAWADMDCDGWLDLVICNQGTLRDLAFRNLGGGRFQKLTTNEVGAIVADAADTISPTFADFDNDGDPDLYVSRETSPNFLYRNSGGGIYEKVQLGSVPGAPATAGGIWADCNNDGFFDLLTTARNSASKLYTNVEGREFRDATAAAGLVTPARMAFGPAWGDFDNDGDLDLFIPYYSATNIMFVNNGDGTFTSRDIGSPLSEGVNDECAVWVDYDNDGFLDLFVACGEANPAKNLLYRNNLPGTGNTNHWLKIQLKGQASSSMGVGAKIRVRAVIGGKETWQLRQIASNGAFASGPELIAHFGLGDGAIADLVRIEWPSGNVQELTSVARDQILTITEVVGITPVRPTASLGGSVTLTSSRTGTWQWFHDGVAMEGRTNRTLALSNLQVADGGRYSVVTDSAGTFYTNFVYVYVDTEFTKITEGLVVADTGNCPAISSGDYDGDGYADLFVTRYQLGSSAVYRNNQDGTFARVLDLPFGKQSNEVGAWGDLNNDGSVDLLHELIGSPGGTCLSASGYFNNGDGTFAVTQRGSMPGYGNRSLVDFNNDGFLDVYYSRFAQNRLYRNNGDETFTLMTVGNVGPVANVTTFGGTCWADYNDDGWPDVYAPNLQDSQSVMFRNDGTGRFAAVNNLVTRTAAPAIAGAWGDYDNDGRLDLCVAALNGTSAVYRNLGTGEFERPAGAPTITGPYNFAAWVDYDNDGFLDLFFSGYKSGNKLFHNNGDGTFTGITTGSIANELPPLGGGSYAGLWFDYDNDGFPDLYVINGDDDSSIPTANQLYHNNGNSNAWLRVKLAGTVSNREGIGAKVRLYAYYAGAWRWQRRDIIGGDEDNGNRLSADFGLGTASYVSKLRIEWPSGVAEEFASVAPRQILTIVEPSLKGSMGLDGKFHVEMTMSTNRMYRLESTTDFVNWTTHTNCTGSGSCTPIEYVDPEAPAAGAARFYRMK